MPLNNDEAQKLVAKCKQLWGNPFKVTSSTHAEWAQMAGKLNFDLMSKSLDSYAAEGSTFPPSLAEITARARTYKVAPGPIAGTAFCDYCGGPYWGGGDRDEHRPHYSWCYTRSGAWVLTEQYRTNEQVEDAPDVRSK